MRAFTLPKCLARFISLEHSTTIRQFTVDRRTLVQRNVQAVLDCDVVRIKSPLVGYLVRRPICGRAPIAEFFTIPTRVHLSLTKRLRRTQARRDHGNNPNE
jgi:hypothetical protein